MQDVAARQPPEFFKKSILKRPNWVRPGTVGWGHWGLSHAMLLTVALDHVVACQAGQAPKPDPARSPESPQEPPLVDSTLLFRNSLATLPETAMNGKGPDYPSGCQQRWQKRRLPPARRRPPCVTLSQLPSEKPFPVGRAFRCHPRPQPTSSTTPVGACPGCPASFLLEDFARARARALGPKSLLAIRGVRPQIGRQKCLEQPLAPPLIPLVNLQAPSQELQADLAGWTEPRLGEPAPGASQKPPPSPASSPPRWTASSASKGQSEGRSPPLHLAS